MLFLSVNKFWKISFTAIFIRIEQFRIMLPTVLSRHTTQSHNSINAFTTRTPLLHMRCISVDCTNHLRGWLGTCHSDLPMPSSVPASSMGQQRILLLRSQYTKALINFLSLPVFQLMSWWDSHSCRFDQLDKSSFVFFPRTILYRRIY